MRARPLLHYVGCYRGAACTLVRQQGGHRIPRGPLKDCVHLPSGPTVRFGNGWALVFKPVIRITL